VVERLRLVILDWDGTVSDSIARIVTCLQMSAHQSGLPEPSLHEGREVIGLGLPEALATLFPSCNRDELEALRDCYSRNYVQLDRDPPDFYPGVQETLAELKSRGIQLAVATGKSRKGLNRVLKGHDMVEFFEATRCADETASKPDPLMLTEILADLGVCPAQAVMVGDTEFDMEMAVRANVDRVGVSYGAHSGERLQRYQLKGCIDHFSLLAELI
jgi:phosphoglycolate phosphatase